MNAYRTRICFNVFKKLGDYVSGVTSLSNLLPSLLQVFFTFKITSS